MSFDAAAYLAQNPDIAAYAAATGQDPTAFAAQHYQTTGVHEIAAGGRQAGFAVNPTPAPEPVYTPPPVAAPTAAPSFNVQAYLAANPDLVAYAQRTGQDPTTFAAQHYQTTGIHEIAAGTRGMGAGSTPTATTPAATPAATQTAQQAAQQAAAQGGLSATDIAALAAAMSSGTQSQAQPMNPFAAVPKDAFDPAGYLALNPDVAQYAQTHGLDATKFAADHYNGAGKAEGRQFTVQPDKAASRITEPGGSPAGGLPTAQTNLSATGITPQPTTPSAVEALRQEFNARAYLEQNPDIAAAAMNSGQDPNQFAVQHYNNTGKAEIAAGTRFASKEAAAAPKKPVTPTPGATWADFYTKVPGVQDWAIKAMQGEFAPSGWAGGPIDSMEEAAAAYQWMYGDGGTGLGFAAKDPSKYLYDPEKPDLNTRGLLDANGNVQVIDANQLANPNVKPFAVQPATQAPAAGAVDWAAYTNRYSDLAAAAKAQGVDAATFGRNHYASTGRAEGREVPGFAPGANVPVGTQGATSWTDPTKADIKANGSQLAGQRYSAGTTVTFDNGRTMTPGTDYYVAYTNSGDPTAVLGAVDNAQYAVIDPKTKEVLFYGVGAEGAKGAAEMATGLSQDKGRKANWQIAVNYTGGTEDADWELAGYDKKDPKNSVLGSIARIVLPIAGALLLPGVGASIGIGGLATATGAATTLGAGLGAAVGSLGASALNGDSLKQALIGAAISGAGAAFLPKLPGMDKLGSAINKIPGMEALNNAITSAQRGLVGAGGGALGGGTGSSVGALAGGAAADTLALPATEAINSMANQVANAAATELGGIVVRPAASAAIAQAIAAGMSGAALASFAVEALQTVDPVVVTRENGQPTILERAAPPALSPNLGPTVDEIVVRPKPPEDLRTTEMIGGSLGVAAQSIVQPQSTFDKVTNGITKNPLGAAGLALMLADALGGGGRGSNYSSSFGSGARPGTRGSLDDIFNETDLPEPDANFAARSGTGYRADETYGFGPEAAFFSDVQGGGGGGGNPFSSFSARPSLGFNFDPGSVTFTGQASPSNPSFMAWVAEQPESVKALVRQILRRQGQPVNFAAGGKVRGPGTGRSDSIRANLSDGEYVIDAETVALLGDGSGEHGAKKLDQFRVNVRKHKGRQLARGGFSAKAKQPERYLRGV